MLVKLVLGLAACTSEELGYDASVRRVVPDRGYSDQGPMYEIDIEGAAGTRTFVTRRLLADFGTDMLCGRGTRVWVVVDKDASKGKDASKDKEYVLKDCWIDSDRQREGAVLELIHNFKHNPTGSDYARLQQGRKHFLTVCVHADVLTTQHARDATLATHRGGVVLKYNTRIGTSPPPGSMRRPSDNRHNSDGKRFSVPSMSSTGGVPVRNDSKPVKPLPPHEALLSRDMQHYRIVFNEVADSLYTLKTFRMIFTAILGAISGVYHCICLVSVMH